MANKEESKHLYVIETAYACGALVSFATKNVELAAKTAATIMTDICPECKEEAGMELTDDDKRVLAAKPYSMKLDEVARNN